MKLSAVQGINYIVQILDLHNLWSSRYFLIKFRKLHFLNSNSSGAVAALSVLSPFLKRGIVNLFHGKDVHRRPALHSLNRDQIAPSDAQRQQQFVCQGPLN